MSFNVSMARRRPSQCTPLFRLPPLAARLLPNSVLRPLGSPTPPTPPSSSPFPAGARGGAVRPGATRRGPGRPPKYGAHTSIAARAIVEFLRAHPGLHGKCTILAASGTDAAAWNAAIKELLEGGQVERQGEKKGARYRFATYKRD